MDELIQNSLIIELHKRVRHGGYSLAENFHRIARFNCNVPYVNCSVAMNFNKHSQKLIVSIAVYNLLFVRYAYIDVYDPGFDPDKMLNDIVDVIKLLKAEFTDMKKECSSVFSTYVINQISDKWSRLGRKDGQHVLEKFAS